MDGGRFDAFTRSMARATSRRTALKVMAGTVMARVVTGGPRKTLQAAAGCDSAVANDCYASAEADTNDDAIDCIEFGPAFIVCMLKVVVKYNNRINRCNRKVGCPESHGFLCSNDVCCGYDSVYDIHLQGCGGECYNPYECLECRNGDVVSNCPPPKKCVFDQFQGFRGCVCEAGTACGDTCCDTTTCETCVEGTCKGCDPPMVCSTTFGFAMCSCPDERRCGDACCGDGQQCCSGVCQETCGECAEREVACDLTSTSFGAIMCCPPGSECCPGNWPSFTQCGPDPANGLCCEAGTYECIDRCCADDLLCQGFDVDGKTIGTCCPETQEACNDGCCAEGEECASCEGVHYFCHAVGDWSMCP